MKITQQSTLTLTELLNYAKENNEQGIFYSKDLTRKIRITASGLIINLTHEKHLNYNEEFIVVKTLEVDIYTKLPEVLVVAENLATKELKSYIFEDLSLNEIQLWNLSIVEIVKSLSIIDRENASATLIYEEGNFLN